MAQEERLELTASIGDARLSISGRVDEVLRALHRFLAEAYPTFDMLRRVTISVDFQSLVEVIEGIIAFAPEGAVILVPREKMTHRDAITVHLLKAYVGYRLGKMEGDTLSMADILAATGAKAGAIAPELSELVQEGLVERVGRGEYRITTLGVKRLMDEVLPRLKR